MGPWSRQCVFGIMAIPGYKAGVWNKYNSSYWKCVQLSDDMVDDDDVIALAGFDNPKGPPLLIGEGGRKYIGTLAINAYLSKIGSEYFLDGIGPPVLLPPRIIGMRGVNTGIYGATFNVGSTRSQLSKTVTVSGIPDYTKVDTDSNFVWLEVVEVPINVTALQYWLKKGDGLFYLLDTITSQHYYEPSPDGKSMKLIEIEEI